VNGVVLLAVGSRSYYLWARNQAASIRAHSPTLQIQLICGAEIAPHIANHRSLFDVVTVLEKPDYTDAKGNLFPAKIKTNLYKFSSFEKSLYLDVDGVVFKDITPVFELDEDFATDIAGVWNGEETFDAMKWAKPEVLKQHFSLPTGSKIPAINSSAMFFRKSPRAEMMFGAANYMAVNQALPAEKMWHKWGRGRGAQPDELYFNMALAKMDWLPKHIGFWFFRMAHTQTPAPSEEWIKENHYAVGLFGNKQMNAVMCYRLYNKFSKESWEAVTGTQQTVRSEHLMDDKYANQKFNHG